MENVGRTAEPLISSKHVSFDAWTQNREVSSLGTNFGSPKLPFQAWHHFKEAFAPEVVSYAVSNCARQVRSCIDPFGGSGTTALACQFLGVEPTTVEVNPYLADLIEAKLTDYSPAALLRSFNELTRCARGLHGRLSRFSSVPPTFIEDEGKDRWIFSRSVAKRIAAYLDAIDLLPSIEHRRFFRVLMGGMLIQVSNVIINGKGRRYRNNWSSLERSPESVDELFGERVSSAVAELTTFRQRKRKTFNVVRGDSRSARLNGRYDLAIFSPPYPNSFDYTDVYNVELWMMGYLLDREENARLRQSTLSSHVQVKRDFKAAPTSSVKLNRALASLRSNRAALWSPWIPEMVGAYFHDMRLIAERIGSRLNARGEVWMVVGDSRYAGIHIPTGDILAEMLPSMGYDLIKSEAFRSMRASPQQGGREELNESLVVVRKQSI